MEQKGRQDIVVAANDVVSLQGAAGGAPNARAPPSTTRLAASTAAARERASAKAKALDLIERHADRAHAADAARTKWVVALVAKVAREAAGELGQRGAEIVSRDGRARRFYCLEDTTSHLQQNLTYSHTTLLHTQ